MRGVQTDLQRPLLLQTYPTYFISAYIHILFIRVYILSIFVTQLFRLIVHTYIYIRSISGTHCVVIVITILNIKLLIVLNWLIDRIQRQNDA